MSCNFARKVVAYHQLLSTMPLIYRWLKVYVASDQWSPVTALKEQMSRPCQQSTLNTPALSIAHWHQHTADLSMGIISNTTLQVLPLTRDVVFLLCLTSCLSAWIAWNSLHS